MPLTHDPVAGVLARTLRPRPATPAAARPGRGDLLLVLAVLVVQTVLALAAPPSDGRALDALGWLLLTGAAALLVLRRRAPWLTAMAVILTVAPYHVQGYAHAAAVPAGLVALYALAVAGPPLRTFLTFTSVIGVLVLVATGLGNMHNLVELLRITGWLLAVVLVGEAVRIHRNYVAAIVERAERAERTREEEAARRVAEERLRIARDLHDLLAHSITLIGVQTSVAAHVLLADPERLDREAVAKALDGIADTCRDARAELRTTLEVLRADVPAPGPHAPLPGLPGLPDLARAAEAAGARVELAVRLREGGAAPPPSVGAAAYRIVQEALTNAVRHAGPSVGISATVETAGDGTALRVTVTDDGGHGGGAGRRGRAPADEEPLRATGFGLLGMRERARTVGGTLRAGPRTDGVPGFSVTALLPLSRPRTAPAPAPAPAPEGPAP